MARRRGSDRYNLIYDQAVKLDQKYLACRVKGHQWGDEETYEAVSRNEYCIWNSCQRCQSENWKYMTIRGSLRPGGIRYPKEYLFDATGVLETADRDILRAVYIAIITSR